MQSTPSAKFHGGGEYAKFVFKELINRGYIFDVAIDSGRELDSEIHKIIDESLKGKLYRINFKKEIYDLASNNNYDIFYTAHPYDYDDYSGSAQFVGVIHGLRTIELPWDKYKYKFYSSLVKRIIAKVIGEIPLFIKYWRDKHICKVKKILEIPNSRFITVSYHSKFSILNFFPFLSSEQISVYYSPFSILKGNRKNSCEKYFLMISGNRYEKNVWRAAIAFDKLFSDQKLNDFKVVIVGSGCKSIWKNLKNKERFDLKGYLSYEDLGNLYANAFGFVYPSLNEGFGYPPLYAMGLGVPVIASSATSIPEVCGEAASYFSPFSIDDLCSRILRLEQCEDYRQYLIKVGYKRVNELLSKQSESLEQMMREIFN